MKINNWIVILYNVMFLFDVKNSYGNMSRDVLYDSDRLESFNYLERLNVERDFRKFYL